MGSKGDDIKRYLSGKMTPSERHDLERRALDDPFLADAIEGAEKISAETFSNDVAEIQKRAKPSRPFFSPLRIAAGIILLAVAGFIVYQFSIDQQPELLTLGNESSKDVDDSLKDELTQPEEQPLAKEEESARAEVKPAEQVTAQKEDDERTTIAQVTPSDDRTDQPVEAKEEDVKTEEREVATEAFALKAEETRERVADTQPVIQPKPEVSSAGATADKKMARAKSAAISSGVVQGRVTSAEDGSGLPGVNVVVKGTTTGTVTDATGHYQIETGMPQPTLVFSFIGLQSMEVQAAEDRTLDVALPLVDVAQLSEVVVTGYGVTGGKDTYEGVANYPTLQLTQPVGGKEQFQAYLSRNVQYPQAAIENKAEGRVTVQFTVGADGTLKDFITIRDIGHGCAEELIRLIKEGPSWTPTQRNGIKMDDKVRVRFKFELPQ
ncbi:MAG: TonB family protein [Cyclobacteriaceae bacterium]